MIVPGGEHTEFKFEPQVIKRKVLFLISAVGMLLLLVVFYYERKKRFKNVD
jgi:hypothetical protein